MPGLLNSSTLTALVTHADLLLPVAILMSLALARHGRNKAPRPVHFVKVEARACAAADEDRVGPLHPRVW